MLKKVFNRKIVLVVFAALLVLGLSACASAPTAVQGAKSSVDWKGVYTGTIPSASGSGIAVWLTLYANDVYYLQYEYVGRDDAVYVEEGSFTWDSAGSVIRLGGASFSPYYGVGEGLLLVLDMQGNAITSGRPQDYVLWKHSK